MNIEKTWGDEQLLLSVTGLTKTEAVEVLNDFQQEFLSATRLGRPPKLDTKSIFMMVLIFYRQYPTLEFLSFIFDIDKSNVKRWIDAAGAMIKDILVKKNLSHILQPIPEVLQRGPSNEVEKFISMALNSPYVDHETKNGKKFFIQEKRKGIRPKSLL